MVILGLGGSKYTKENAVDTAKVINAVQPDYVGALTLYLENGIKEEFLTKFEGEFERLTDSQAIDELELFVVIVEIEIMVPNK